METTIPHALSLGTIENADYDAFVAFVDRAFGRRAGCSLRQDFPTALGRDNQPHQFVGRIDDEIVCAAAAWVRPWITSAGKLETACLGSFATPEPLRGRGYSAALQQFMLARLAEEGVHWAVLWTDRPEFYRGRGFVEAGSEWHGRLDEATWPQLEPGMQVDRVGPDEAPELLELYRTHSLRAERQESDFRAHLDPRTSTVLLLSEAGRPRAYVAMGKGSDFQGYVHEYAGDRHAVHTLWGLAVAAGARFVLVPQGGEDYLGGVAKAMPRRIQAAALVKVFDPKAMPGSLADLRWAAWGFDSA